MTTEERSGVEARCRRNESKASGAGDTGGRPNSVDAARFFRMGAAVALGEMMHDGVIGRTPESGKLLRRYLASFGIGGMQDIDELGISGVYRYDFEALY